MIAESRRSKAHFYAKIIEDSVSPGGVRLVTAQWRFPRVILAEVNTHRMLSKSSASSRAIPFYVDRPGRLRALGQRPSMLEMIEENPYYPIFWGKNQGGMQAWEEMSPEQIDLAVIDYQAAMYDACRHARNLWKLGLHKQDCNRLIEPFAWCTQVTSGTDWANMFALRTHKDAHPAFQLASRLLYAAIRRSAPTQLKDGEWHLPYVKERDLDVDQLKKISAVRCARVSYLNQDGDTSREQDLRLFNKLSESVPKHMGPFDHVATPGKGTGNFRGWNQYRAEFKDENITHFEPSEEELISWGVW